MPTPTESHHDFYPALYGSAVAVTVIIGMLGAALTFSDALELSRQQVALMAVASAGLGILNGFLPRVNKTPNPRRAGMD